MIHPQSTISDEAKIDLSSERQRISLTDCEDATRSTFRQFKSLLLLPAPRSPRVSHNRRGSLNPSEMSERGSLRKSCPLKD